MTKSTPNPVVPESAWFKSSYSSGEGGQCVEVAATTGAICIRDSKDLMGPVLTVSPESWMGFVGLMSGRSA
jgi:hypothetical protein